MLLLFVRGRLQHMPSAPGSPPAVLDQGRQYPGWQQLHELLRLTDLAVFASAVADHPTASASDRLRTLSALHTCHLWRQWARCVLPHTQRRCATHTLAVQ